MADELYGPIEALRRARGWMPHLTTGQQRVFSAMLMFCSFEGIMSPTAPQITELTGLKDNTVRTRLYELRQKGAIRKIGSRPILDDGGIAHGASIPKYIIPTFTTDSDTGNSHLHSESVPLSLKSAPTVTPGSDTLEVELLEEESSDFYQQVEQLASTENISVAEAFKRLAPHTKTSNFIEETAGEMSL